MVRIALGQLNTTVGDLDGNVARMAEWATHATEAGADLVWEAYNVDIGGTE